MVGTIGSLVKGAGKRRLGAVCVALHFVGALTTAGLVGAALGALGRWTVGLISGPPELDSLLWTLTAATAIAYAGADLGYLRMPRPTIMGAVPVSWWRRWGPQRASVLYGAALGIGVTTRIPFGAFYIVCLWCVIRASPGYGALVFAGYGGARALMVPLVPWIVEHRVPNGRSLMPADLLDLPRAQTFEAAALVFFATWAIASATVAMTN